MLSMDLGSLCQNPNLYSSFLKYRKMPTYKTPGVYVQEISLFPPSIAEVETAIPAFIGYTEFAAHKGRSLTNVPTRISSQLEFREKFGSNPDWNPINVQLDANNDVKSVSIAPPYKLFKAIQLFFANGGGNCYIVSIGNYKSVAPFEDRDAFIDGLKQLEKMDEPTLLLFPDAVNLPNTELYDVQKAALAQCQLLGDRFCILDLLETKTTDKTFDWKAGVQEFRSNIGVNALKYGGAYLPHLKTSIDIRFSYKDVKLKDKADADIELNAVMTQKGENTTIINRIKNAITNSKTISDFIKNPTAAANPKTASELWAAIASSGKAQITDKLTVIHTLILKLEELKNNLALVSIDIKANLDDLLKKSGTLNNIANKLKQYDIDYYDNAKATEPIKLDYTASPFTGYALPTTVTAPDKITNIYSANSAAATTEEARALNATRALQSLFDDINLVIENLDDYVMDTIANLEKTLQVTSPTYANIVTAIREQASLLPPSAAIAGVYTMVDADRGVWKAPANVSLNYVVAPSVNLDQFEQESLNVDVNGGKSINAIRAFVNKGTLVWGARTLAGNDNEWRYISVRRFFNMVEESVKKSTEWAVFEPNDAKTWGKVKGMIENYLYQKWMDGALAGAKFDDAYFVKVGLGLTMTAQDILEGRMIIEIGMAVVRPAEFIILKFSHKLQRS
jgi:phage tail sheath protein FI